VKKLCASGFEVLVEKGAGAAAGYADELYTAAGATLGSRDEAFAQATVIKVRPPSLDEIAKLAPDALLISLVQPASNPGLVEAMAKQKVTSLALEKIPRVTRAQKMDVLSSQANLAGYRAVIEAAAHFQGFFGPAVTAAGSTPPTRVMVIGAGVAGLAALGAAKALGAEVRAFDTRAAAREQVESLGGKFLTVEVKESGEGQGGYAKQMSKEFIEAEHALFKAQAADVSVVITTALVPGAKAPVLMTKEVIAAYRPGTVMVDMAAEQGGNCDGCKPGEVADVNGVKILGFTDLASRMANTASKFFAMNLVHLLEEMGGGKGFKIDLDNDVVRPALLTHRGEVLPPPPVKEPTAITKAPPAAVVAPKAAEPEKPKEPEKPDSSNTLIAAVAMLFVLFMIGRYAPRDFLAHATVFVLACFVGWQVVWAVTPALHTPLMSVTNAISGIIIVGGMLQVGNGFDPATILGAAAVLLAAINIAGGFAVTQRMLKMFHRETAPSKGGH